MHILLITAAIKHLLHSVVVMSKKQCTQTMTCSALFMQNHIPTRCGWYSAPVSAVTTPSSSRDVCSNLRNKVSMSTLASCMLNAFMITSTTQSLAVNSQRSFAAISWQGALNPQQVTADASIANFHCKFAATSGD